MATLLPFLQAQAAQLYRLNMTQYRQLKAQLVAATAVLVGLGSGMAYAAGGRDLALPFALGGASGVLYQYMLQVRGPCFGGCGPLQSCYGLSSDVSEPGSAKLRLRPSNRLR